MSLAATPDWRDIQTRLRLLFPEGVSRRAYCISDMAAKTVFVMLYLDAVQGRDRWARPDQVTRMTDAQAQRLSDDERNQWAAESMRAGTADIRGRWYAPNTREPIRDDTLRYSLVATGAVVSRSGLPTTSPAPRYALETEFAALFDPALDQPAFAAAAAAWRQKHLTVGALARVELNRRAATEQGDAVLVTFPNGETRRLSPGPSATISKAVIEDFAIRFLRKPGVIFLSESGAKVVARDDALARAINLIISADRVLPDIVLVDLGPEHPRLIFVEVVHSDGPVNDHRRADLLRTASSTGFDEANVAFVTAFLDRSQGAFKKLADDLAWGTFAWFAAEPERLILLADGLTELPSLQTQPGNRLPDSL